MAKYFEFLRGTFVKYMEPAPARPVTIAVDDVRGWYQCDGYVHVYTRLGEMQTPGTVAEFEAILKKAMSDPGIVYCRAME